ncbi:Os12g0261250, partial [Oryza sativa Japonica Group]
SHRLDLLLLVRSPRRTPTPISTARQRRLYRYLHIQGQNATRRCASTRTRLGFFAREGEWRLGFLT